MRYLFSTILLLLFLPISSWASILYLEPASGEYYQGDTFIVKARINTAEECINTVEANLSFSQNILEATDFSQGDSILTLWINSPVINQELGTISFIGGIPGGYCGRLPGDPGESNLLGKIIFKVKNKEQKSATAEVRFLNTSQILLNDGLGTLAEFSTKKAIFTVLSGLAEVPKTEWQEELAEDKTLPEIFEIEINQDRTIFEDKYFITFSTTDKQTGVDYYEVKEGKKDWQEAASPYLLADQSLRSIIRVKAVDKAGNERIAEYLPPAQAFPYWIIILGLLGLGIIYWVIRIIKRR